MALSQKRRQQTYDHRIRNLVRTTGDPDIVADLGVPRSTALGWWRSEYQSVVTADVFDMDQTWLQAEVIALQHRLERLAAVIRLLMVLVRSVGARLDRTRLPEGTAKVKLLQAVARTQGVLSLRGALRVLGLSPSRYHRWRTEQDCELDDRPSCPRSMPTRLTPEEILTTKEMVESPQFRHVPTGRLAILAQRLGRVFAAPATWYRLVRERARPRPRMRLHPAKPKDGARASVPDELCHVDTTVIRLLDGTKVYLHAVIDNFSRRILAWRVTGSFLVATTVAILQDAVRGALTGNESPTLVADAGVEDVNTDVDGLIEPNRAASCRACGLLDPGDADAPASAQRLDCRCSDGGVTRRARRSDLVRIARVWPGCCDRRPTRCRTAVRHDLGFRRCQALSSTRRVLSRMFVELAAIFPSRRRENLMSKRNHKACYGTMFHETLHFTENAPMRGKVFSFELHRAGLVRSGRSIDADISEWDDCLDCEEFQHCYQFCMAKLLLQTAIGRE